MAITSFVSSFELQRVARRAYEGKTARVFLCNLASEGFDETNPVTDWRTIELAEVLGYLPSSSVLSVGTYDAVDGRYEMPSFDAAFVASGGVISWNTVVVYIDDPQNEAESVTDTDISFDAASNEIRQVAGDFAADGFVAGDYVVVSGSTNNDGAYEIVTVTATALTVDSDRTPITTPDAAGPTVTLQRASVYPYSVITESPNISLADGQAYSYRISLNTNDG